MSALDELIERKRAELQRLKKDVAAREEEIELLLRKREDAGRLSGIRKAAFGLGVQMKIAKMERAAPRFDKEPRTKKTKGGQSQ